MQDKEKLASLPQYQSHKVVRGAKILEMVKHEDGVRLILDAPSTLGEREVPTTTIEVTAEWMLRFTPVVGNWFVVYDEDYASISPDDKFVNGYRSLGLETGPLYETPDGVRIGLVERVARDMGALKAFSKKVDDAIAAVVTEEFNAPQQIHNYRAKLIKEYMETQYAGYKQVVADRPVDLGGSLSPTPGSV